jgi:carbon-monoxide dehydrogenase large subunit
MSILGNRVVRREDPAFLTTGAVYLADVRDPILDGALFATFVRSTVAHGELVSVDVSDARSAPGVVAVFTGDDVDLAPGPAMGPQGMVRPWLARGHVRFAGEPVAAVLSDTPAQGEDAAEMVIVDIDPLPVVIDLDEAVRGEVLLFPEAGTNVATTFGEPPDDDPFEHCEVVVRQRIVNQRVAACPLEVRASAAAWIDGRLVQFSSTQAPHGVKESLTTTYELDPTNVRVVAPDVGGGFGAKVGVSAEEMLLPWLARQVGRPVRFVETRSEGMVAMGHGRAQVQHVEIGGRRDGTIEAYRLTVEQDTGAYPAIGAFLPYMTRLMTSGTYDIDTVQCHTTSLATNTAPTIAFRGAGRPEAAAAIERAVDLFAAEINADPVDVRRRNFIAADAFPFTTPMDATYDSGDYRGALDLVCEQAGYDELRAEQRRRREAGEHRLLGIGIATYVEVTAGPVAGQEWGRVDVRTDGTAVIYTGTSPHGQGHATAWSQIANEVLGIPIDDIEVVHGDTDLVPQGVGTFGSRSLQLGGSAIHGAATDVVDQARKVAAGLLEARPDDVVLDKIDGRFHVAGVPAVSRSWAEVAQEAQGLTAELDFHATGPTFPFGAHLAVVEVDVETGAVELIRFVAVDDAGRILNPLLAEGQRHGGIAQGAAQALLEEMRYDNDGNPMTTNFADYAIISATELPSFELVAMETPSPHNPLGAKGIGESGTIGSTPAVQNAVVDAVSHLGVRHIDMPASPERVWRAISEAAS